jgi:hypothetical protein
MAIADQAVHRGSLDAHSGTAERVSRLVRSIRERLKEGVAAITDSNALACQCNRLYQWYRHVVRRNQVQAELPLLHLLVPRSDEHHYGEPNATFSWWDECLLVLRQLVQQMSMSAGS